jgi:hypothetical protein
MLAGMLNHAPPDPNVSEDVPGDSSQNKMNAPLSTAEKVLPQPDKMQILETDSHQR